MTLIEKTAYLKGLLDGMDKDDKIVNLMAEILRDIALELEDKQDQIDEINEMLDSIDDALDEYDDDDSFDDYKEYSDDYSDDYEGEDDEDMYETTCPTCGNTIVIDEGTLNTGSVSCPECGELLEFDIDGVEEDDE